LQKCRVFAPKGHNITARGNAPGIGATTRKKALKGRNKALFRPFRAWGIVACDPRAALRSFAAPLCPGLLCFAPLGRRQAVLKTYFTAQLVTRQRHEVALSN